MKNNEKVWKTMKNLQRITCGASPTVHHLRSITCGASSAVHHLRSITCGASPAVHHLRCITCHAFIHHHHIWHPWVISFSKIWYLLGLSVILSLSLSLSSRWHQCHELSEYIWLRGSVKYWKWFNRVFSGRVGVMTDTQTGFQLIDSAHP